MTVRSTDTYRGTYKNTNWNYTQALCDMTVSWTWNLNNTCTVVLLLDETFPRCHPVSMDITGNTVGQYTKYYRKPSEESGLYFQWAPFSYKHILIVKCALLNLNKYCIIKRGQAIDKWKSHNIRVSVQK